MDGSLIRISNNHADEVMTNILANYLLGHTKPDPVGLRDQVKLGIILALAKNAEAEYKKSNIITHAIESVTGRPSMNKLKKACLTGVLMVEGFNVVMFDDEEEIKDLKDSPHRIEIKDKKNRTLLFAKLHYKKREKLPSSLEQRRTITDTIHIENVYLKNDNCVSYSDLDKFIKELEIIRWKKLI
jgi:hypothetical protein